MQSHQLKTSKKKSRKRVARGGKRGTYSGRGMKGQKSRSGGNVDPLFEGGRSSLVERMKKTKGFKSIHAKKNILSLAQLDTNFKDGEEVNIRALVRRGLIDPARVTRGVKILGNGELKKKLTIAENILLTESAKEAVEKAGGGVVKSQKSESQKLKSKSEEKEKSGEKKEKGK